MRMFLASISVAAAILGCSKPIQHPTSRPVRNLVNPDASALPPDQFMGITSRTTLGELIKQLGPARRVTGSGFTYLHWDSTDGRQFTAGFAELSESSLPVLGAGFDPK